MERFEKCLKLLLDRYNADCLPIYCPNCKDMGEGDFRFLAAKGLVSLLPEGDDTFYSVPTDKGLTYFQDKREERRSFWRAHIVNFVGGFVSGVLTAVLGGVILQMLLQ